MTLRLVRPEPPREPRAPFAILSVLAALAAFWVAVGVVVIDAITPQHPIDDGDME